jgi:hypothetical protein
MATGDLQLADEDGPVEQIGGFVNRCVWGFDCLYRLRNME